MAMLRSFTDEQARALVNLRQRYEVWIEAARARAALPYDLRRKEVSGKAYLYEIRDRSGNGKSLGPWSDGLKNRFEAFRAEKLQLKERIEASRIALDESSKLARALRVPMIASEAGPTMREGDRRGLLDGTLLVVGTNAVAAYALEAGDRKSGVEGKGVSVRVESGGGGIIKKKQKQQMQLRN